MDLSKLPVPRRGVLQGVVAALGAVLLPRLAHTDEPVVAGARLAADFEPAAAIWLGYDPGHEAFTVDLAAALWRHVPIRMLVRDQEAEAQARATLQRHGLDPERVRFVHDPHAPYFVRDAAVFGLDGQGARFIVDFEWTYYGWAHWCRRRFAGDPQRAGACARTSDRETGELDRRLADALGLARFSSPLAAEGGGLEVNGQGLLIANDNLWRGRNRAMGRNAIERQLLRLPGIRKVIWLPQGLASDPLHRATITGQYVGWGTGGHTDEFVRFADANTVLLAWADEMEARIHPVARANQLRMQANFDILSRSTDQDGKPLRVVKVPLPRTVERSIVLSADADPADASQWSAASFPAREGRREGDTVQQVATCSYLNHVVANRLVLLPDYVAHGTPQAQQEQVRRIYEAAMPGRRVVFVDALSANWGGGGPHCATLSEPLGRT